MARILETAEWRQLDSSRFGFFRRLEWVVSMTQGDPTRHNEFAWMHMPMNLANHLSKERVESHVVKFPTKAVHLTEELTRDDIAEYLGRANGESDSLLLPRAVTVAKIIRTHQRDLGLTRLNEGERKDTNLFFLGALGTEPTPQEMWYPFDTLMPTSSTDSKGNVVVYELPKPSPMKRHLVKFFALPRDTKFKAFVPIMVP